MPDTAIITRSNAMSPDHFSWLRLEQWILSSDWERFCIELANRTLQAFQGRRVFLILPAAGQPEIHAQAVTGQRALAFAQPQQPEHFFGLAGEELIRQMSEPVLSIQPVDYAPHDIWDDVTASSSLYRVTLPLMHANTLVGLLYVEFGDLDHVAAILDSAAFHLECEAIASLLLERHVAHNHGRDSSPDEITERLRVGLMHAEEDRARLQKLHQVTLKLTDAPDLDELYRRAVSLSLSELDLDRVAIFETDFDKNEMRGTYGTDNNGQLTDEHWFISTLPVHPLFEESLKRPGEVIANEDAALYYNKVVVGRGWNAMIGLWLDGRMIGWIATDNFLRRRPLQPSQREMLKLFAAILSQLIGVKRVEQEMRTLNLQLAAARDHAEAANRAKSEFLATISHEIRTPLNGVLGFVQLLRETPLTGEQTDYVDTIAHSGDTLLSLINDLLDFSKIEAGKFVLESKPFDLRVAAAEACTMLGARAAEKRLALRLSIAPDLPAGYLGDAIRMKQVLVNLIGNALKFTEQGEVHVTLAPAPQGIRIAVSDTGIGIAADKLPQLFQRFYQVDSTSTRRYGGTGLGLAICKLLVEQMDGEIGVESCEAHGTTFWFTLPASPADAGPLWAAHWQALPADLATLAGCKLGWDSKAPYHDDIRTALAGAEVTWVPPEQADIVFCDNGTRHAHARGIIIPSWDVLRDLPLNSRPLKLPLLNPQYLARQLATLLRPVLLGPPRAAPHSSDAGPFRLLLAEDSSVNQRVMSYFLAKRGYEVVVAQDGQEAVQLASQFDFDLVLMDWQMPRMDGLAAAQALRAQPRSRHWPIIALTANAGNDNESQCLEAGMNAFIAKPIDLQKLDALIRHWLPAAKPH
ncbi:Signal transduction histidine kinase [Andreprevotia lacus DSM 23236]|jgi:signal transduction histidine kinase/ActR/RegA family two-component response regulator|uniref:Virulence sensor protein BvgS n=1 Tax=Andreprevotia lacus DSM 23236 TaxID=1121001 RepID=A0A1W1X6F7_9NEIS|nr:ATP-binding protein [Andreprevotia lacus]SMC19522.1 Signal transduction histidine kinase [Andreprevotia lacus DSM 23236]